MKESAGTASSLHLASSGPPPGSPYYYRVQAVQDIVIELQNMSEVSPSEFRVLDVGCGRGELVEGLTRQGFSVVGTDFA